MPESKTQALSEQSHKTTEKEPIFPQLNAQGKQVYNTNGEPVNDSLYSITSIRITYINIANSIQNLLGSFLTTLGVLIIVTGLLLITNIQLMSVEDREFQTGVLRAVGENRPGISRIYLLETIFQGVIGGILGLGGGLIFGWTVAFYLTNLFGTGAGTVTPSVPASLIIFSVILGVVIAIVTGLLPAIRASRVNIVEALRGIKLFFEEKSSRNFIFIGIIIFIIGLLVLLDNGVFNTNYQPFWEAAGWNTIDEQQTIFLGLGLIFTGLGTILTRFIDRIKAINITAFFLWALPVTAYMYTIQWVTTGSNGLTNTTDFLLITITEIVIGSVLLVGLNLNLIMGILRRFLLNFNIFKGVGQISPAMIKSHKTRSTLTFAIFAVVLTLNVTIASLVATQTYSTIGKANSDSRGVDIAVTLSSPENTSFSYASLIKNLDPHIKDVIPFRTCSYCAGTNNPFLVFINNPLSTTFDSSSQQVNLNLVEVTPNEIRGNLTSSSNPNWRYDPYLTKNGYPDPVRPQYNSKMSDSQLLDLSRQSWNYLFNYSYEMASYNLSIKNLGFGSGGTSLQGKTKLLNANGSIVTNPIVFTDSPLLHLGQQIWLQMNTTTLLNNKTIPVYQTFTIGGIVDRERAAGFPFSPRLGSIFMTQYWTNMTNFFGQANTPGVIKQGLTQYNAFAVKTSYQINSPNILKIAQHIEDFTNSETPGSYRSLTHNKFIRASSVTIWSEIQSNLQALDQITSFLQIYVSFGLIIGSLGMAVIAIRNVAERKREIGMMRAIGFPRGQVMLSVLLELFVLGAIGLVIGVSNGLIINYGLANLANNTVVIPWDTIVIYLGFIAFVAILSGAIPGWVAARIPASDALRYTG